MNNEALSYDSNEIAEAFRSFGGDYLADVLRVWDCYKQDWADDTTYIFRFENDDLLIWKESGLLHCERGAVDTTEVNEEVLARIAAESNIDLCLCWRSDAICLSLTGNTITVERIIERITHQR